MRFEEILLYALDPIVFSSRKSFYLFSSFVFRRSGDDVMTSIQKFDLLLATKQNELSITSNFQYPDQKRERE